MPNKYVVRSACQGGRIGNWGAHGYENAESWKIQKWRSKKIQISEAIDQPNMMMEDSIDSNQPPFTFAAIDDVCWKLVAQFAAPPNSKCGSLQ